MLEIVVGLFLLTVGALGYAALTASMARAFLIDSRRARAGVVANTQREILLREGCAAATSGSALRFGLRVDWTVGPIGGANRPTTIVVTRGGATSILRDSLPAVIPCM